MKRLIILPFLFGCSLQAVCFTEDPLMPFDLYGSYLSTAKAPFRTKEVKGEKIAYSQREASFSYVHPFNPYCGLYFGAGYLGSEVDWKENPFFSQTEFNYIALSTGGFTNAMPDWEWSVLFSMLVDTETLDLGHYALYQGVLWGRYIVCEPLALDFGVILELGLHKDKVWPLIGFEYSPFEDLMINVVYPLDLSIEYIVSPAWTVASSIRILRNRHRLSENAALPQGIFEYESWGGEFDLVFQPWDWVAITGFAGSTFDGDLKITDRNNHHAKHFKFDGAFYSGISAEISF